MKDIILNKLKEIEIKENVTILFAVESGSRAWGFHSPDSDYDVRFIYVRNKEFYLKLEDTRDVIELPIIDDLDINGWDLDKAFKLLYNSNPTLFEWIHSPIVYKTTDAWENIYNTMITYFRPKGCLYHYYHMCKKDYERHICGDYVVMKKYFYVLRPLLCCKWIIDRKSVPPVVFKELFDSYLDDDIKPIVVKLLEEKMKSNEKDKSPKIDGLNEYIDNQIRYITSSIESMTNDNYNSINKLEEIFATILNEIN